MVGGPLICSTTTVLCGHGGKATQVPTQMRVRAGGVPVAVAADPCPVAGCPLPAPCTMLTYLVPAQRVRIGGKPVLTHGSQPMGNGPGQVVVGQSRVRAR